MWFETTIAHQVLANQSFPGLFLDRCRFKIRVPQRVLGRLAIARS
jgi:hypothetical protein